MVVVAVMAIGDLELGGVGEAHGHLLVVDKVEVGSVLILLAPLVLYLGAGHAVGIKQVVEVSDQPMGVGSSGAEGRGRGGGTGAKGQHQIAAEISRKQYIMCCHKRKMSPHHLIPTRLLIDKLQTAILHVMIQTPRSP